MSLLHKYSLVLLCCIFCARPAFCKSGTYLDSLEKQLSLTAHDTARVDILLEIVRNIECANGTQRLKYIREAIALSGEIENKDRLFESKLYLADHLLKCQNDVRKALPMYDECLRIASYSNSKDNQFSAYSRLAECYSQQAEYGKAIAMYNRILALGIDNDRIIQTLGNIGLTYQGIGDFANALDNYQRAYTMLNRDIISAGNPTVEDTLMLMGLKHQIANIYYSIPDYDRALTSYNEVLKLNEHIQFDWFFVLTDIGIGDCYLNKKQYDKAIFHYQKARNTLAGFDIASTEKRENQAKVADKLAEAFYYLDRLDSAKHYSEISLQTASGNGKKILPQLPKTYTTLGKIYTSLKKNSTAIGYFQNAIAISQQIGATDMESNAWLEFSNAYKRMNRTDEALEAYQKHIELRDSLYSRKKLQDLTRIDMQGYFDRQQLADSVKMAAEKAKTQYELQQQRILTYSGFGGLALLIALSFAVYRNYRREKKANVIISEANKAISNEKQISERLLLNILPEEVADELKRNGKVEAKEFDPVTVMFTDFVDFTGAAEKMSPQQLVEELDSCFKAFDAIISKYDIEKIKTIGDGYLVVAGLPVPNKDHAQHIVSAAAEIAGYMKKRKAELGTRTFDIRIGIHTGSVVAGVVGDKKFAYDIWGDTVNTAARMEQNSEPGRINISEETYKLVKENIASTYRGEYPVKNKGMMKMYFIG